VDWETLLARSVSFLQQAKSVAAKFDTDHSEHVPDVARFTQLSDVRELREVSQRLNAVTSNAQNASCLLDMESQKEKEMSKCVSELQSEVTQLQRTISIRKNELKDMHARLDELRNRLPVPERPKATESQRKRLETLFREYSTIWRNICFVEHHLHRIKTDIFCL
jgi:predicted nuclease with TOPRIM domain